jgi:hypothetical protein
MKTAGAAQRNFETSSWKKNVEKLTNLEKMA